MVNVDVKMRIVNGVANFKLAEFDLRWNLMLPFKGPALQKMCSEASYDTLHIFCFHMTPSLLTLCDRL